MFTAITARYGRLGRVGPILAVTTLVQCRPGLSLVGEPLSRGIADRRFGTGVVSGKWPTVALITSAAHAGDLLHGGIS